ncbi:LpqB family beta-propeller domain-containing protein [Arthrobacter alpinus]|uniref:LpqB family beta-propeller domain-containing protein n=1 Tax=Arthrobacter alpinus TaxID=656366 RepID=UPI0012FECD41|nr:LpqB family beta-propeller domain-containing protein [Arthrobacter alpinus]
MSSPVRTRHPRRLAPGVRRNWAALAAVMAAVVLLAISGCAVIPTHGSVGKSDPLTPRNNEVNVGFQQFAPVAGSSPENIIRGFIDSGTGLSDDFQYARQYLTPGLAQSWAPDKRTLVYKDTFSVVPGREKDTFVLKFSVVSSVDATGVLTPAKDSATENVTVKMVQVDGEWRISETPDGVILTEATFQTLFSPFSLYFYDPTFTYGVPDVRWLAGRSSRTATAIVKAMLAGPAPYLQGAVVSAFPNGIALERDSVPVNEGGVAKVGLTAQALLETSVKQRRQMQAQLLVTLQKSLNTVTEVQFLADDREVDMGGPADSIPPITIDNTVPSTQVALAKNELVTFDGSKISPIAGMPSVADLLPSVPAISYSGNVFAFRSGAGNQIYSVRPEQVPVLAISGVGLTPPSFAPNGWLWSAAGDGSGMIIAVNPDDGGAMGKPVVMSVPWLVGQEVTSLRISRDGSRALVVSHANGVTLVSVTGILKTADTPKELTVPLSLSHSGSPVLGLWVGESSVAVTATSATENVSIEILDLALEPVGLEALPGIEWISASTGLRNVHAQTATQYYSNTSSSWEVVAKDLRQASFAG